MPTWRLVGSLFHESFHISDVNLPLVKDVPNPVGSGSNTNLFLEVYVLLQHPFIKKLEMNPSY